MVVFHNLTGSIYSGKFEIEARSKICKRRGSDGYDGGSYTYMSTDEWFEGLGAITNLRDGGKVSFRFRPEGNSEGHIILLERGIGREAIGDYAGAIDISLDLMYKLAMKSDGVVPEIILPVLTLDMLIEKELLIV